MSGGDIFCDRVLTRKEILDGLEYAFHLAPERVQLLEGILFGDLSEAQDAPRDAHCYVNTLSKGEFFFHLDINIYDHDSGYFDFERAAAFCKYVGCRGLTADDTVNPYRWLLCDYDGRLYSVAVDVALFDDEETSAFVINKDSFEYFGIFAPDTILPPETIQKTLAHIFLVRQSEVVQAPSSDQDMYPRATIQAHPGCRLIFTYKASALPTFLFTVTIWMRRGFPWLPLEMQAIQWKDRITRFCKIHACSAFTGGISYRMASPEIELERSGIVINAKGQAVPYAVPAP